jgi:hypothetical protein
MFLTAIPNSKKSKGNPLEPAQNEPETKGSGPRQIKRLHDAF